MSEGLRKRGDTEAQTLADSLKSENAQKFGIATRYIESESQETKRLQAELIEVERGHKSLGEVFGGSKITSQNTLVSSEISGLNTESPLPDFTEFNSRAYDAYIAMNEPTGNNEVEEQAAKLRASVAVYQAQVDKKSYDLAAESAATSTSSSDLAAYQYRGIYTMDGTKQIRLFDYTDDLSGSERAIVVNRLGNGAKEYIYKSGNGLYLKSKIGNAARVGLTDTIKTLSLEEVLKNISTPTAPNNFSEKFASSGEITFGFQPGNSKTDTIFGLDFYDYIDRYNRQMAGEVLPLIQPGTLVGRVDLVPDLPNETVQDTSKP